MSGLAAAPHIITLCYSSVEHRGSYAHRKGGAKPTLGLILKKFKFWIVFEIYPRIQEFMNQLIY